MKTLQIRNVPDDVHAALVARAAAEGRSLSSYALAELTRAVATPTLTEWAERVRSREPVVLPDDIDIASLIREERAAR
ncbi:MAG: FitA-like ribbon-helix-helix domain-containing protein [Thermoleophilia bacterium]|jgi:plasmid stability protein